MGDDRPARAAHAGEPVGARIAEPVLAWLYARALVAIARADDRIDADEGVALERCLAARLAAPVAIDALLLAEPLEPSRLADAVRSAGPFRGSGLAAPELARLLIADGLAVVTAKGYVAEVEARELLRFAAALGCGRDEVRARFGAAAPWVGALA